MDFAIPFRLPYDDVGRWVSNKVFESENKDFKPQLNIGIGYPF